MGKNLESFKNLSDHYGTLDNQDNDFRNNNLTNLLVNYVTGTSILDVGCGTGYFLKKLSTFKKIRCYGLDPNPHMRKLHKKLNTKIKIYNLHYFTFIIFSNKNILKMILLSLNL